MKGYFFTWALVAIGSFGTFKSPLIALAVYVAFAILRPHFLWGYGGNLGGISEIVGAALIGGWLLHNVGSWDFGRARGIVYSLIAFSLWATVSASQANNTDVAWGWVLNLWKFVLPFLVGVTMIRTEQWARRMLWIIVLSQGYVAWEMNLSYLQGNNQLREYGFGGMDNNSVGIGLVSALGPAVALLGTTTDWKARAAALASAAFIGHAALLTFSRGAMLGLIAVGVFGLIIMPKRPKHLAIVLGIFLVTLRFTGPELVSRFESSFVEEENLDASAAGRVELWRDCLTVALTYPMLGIGPNNWPLIAQSFGWTPLKSAHSVWIQTMAEMGFPGLFFLAMFFLLAFVKMWPMARTKNKDPISRERALIATGVMLAIVGYAISGQFVTLTGLELPYYVVMVGAALLINIPAAAMQKAGAPVVSTPASRNVRLPIPALAHPIVSAAPRQPAGPRRFLPDDLETRRAPAHRFLPE